ncbi:hypothetical protein [Candidatus Uabimicrobium amorphum]|uniref:Uncharacterized protein n=1 Tax=Uabimicrobium amorphum TaxID=2596890 RepID=A0A5S9INL1_UABAM|nr:hypothetical protein [Candidatus Uabimicrobium amorphum]BBM84831.1 hypothetical protein UABAM_03192 [Candidatus Uabimicrobium amorphum]
MPKYYILGVFILCIITMGAQEQDNKRIENLEKENKKLQQQLQTQNDLLQKLQKKLIELEKAVLSLKEKDKPLSAKEKQEWLKKITEQQKKLVKSQGELQKLRNDEQQLFILHGALASFCEKAKKFNTKDSVDKYLQQKKIKYTFKEQKLSKEVYAQSLSYEFIVDDINLICELIASIEKQYVAIQKLELKSVQSNIKVDLHFYTIDVVYIKNELSKAKKLITNVKSTKETKKSIEENKLPTYKVSLQQNKNIFNKKRNLPTSVSTESRILPVEKQQKKPKKKPQKTVKKSATKISVSTAKDAQKKLQEITDKTNKIQKVLVNAKQIATTKELIQKMKKQIANRQINTAYKLNKIFSLVQQNPLVIDSLVLDYQKQGRKKPQYKYTWKIDCFYFATSLEPTVAFIEKLVVQGFSNQTPLQFKKKTLMGRKGYQFLLNLSHSAKNANDKS